MALDSAPALGSVVEDFVGVRFKMRDGQTIVDCIVSREALQDRGARDGRSHVDLADLFASYRSEIEDIAAKKHAAGIAEPKVTSAELAP